jgi:hypothetical protein
MQPRVIRSFSTQRKVQTKSRRKVLVVKTNDALTAEGPNGISRRLDECKGSDFSDLESVQNLLEV